MDTSCVFCRIARHEARADVIVEDDEVLAFPDIAPKYPVHILCIPRRHIPSAASMQPEHDALLGKILRVGASIARERGLGDRGFRLLVNTGPDSGQVVPHLHVHVLGGEPLRPI